MPNLMRGTPETKTMREYRLEKIAKRRKKLGKNGEPDMGGGSLESLHQAMIKGPTFENEAG